MNNKPMLNAYPDSMGGKLSDIAGFLEREETSGAFGSIYILPSVYHSDLDRGFSVISYDLNRIYAKRSDIDRLKASGLELKLDFVLNHISVLSPQFQDLVKNGDKSEYRDFFINWNEFWDGMGEMTDEGYIQPDEKYISKMFFRKPGLPILMIRFPDGKEVPYWNTFYQRVEYTVPDPRKLMESCGLQYGQALSVSNAVFNYLEEGVKPSAMEFDVLDDEERLSVIDWMESHRSYLGQMDVNIRSELVWKFYDEVLDKLAGYGTTIVRLDAFGYASKIPGHRNFMNDPETWDILERIRVMAESKGITLLPEIHDAYTEKKYMELAKRNYLSYDFFLPGLLIDAIEFHESSYLVKWANEQIQNGIRSVNMLGCHDGIPMLDLKGLVPDERIQELIDLIVSRGGLIKNLHGKKNMYYQVNATYYSALGADERKMLLARAVQLFMPGKPQIWYLDLFAGENDWEAVERYGEDGHKEINRTNLSNEEIEERLNRIVVRDQLALLRMRSKCGAFDDGAEIKISAPEESVIDMEWHNGGNSAELLADFSTYSFSVRADMPDGETFEYNQE